MIIKNLKDVEYGHFIVKKDDVTKSFFGFQSSDGAKAYGVFRIDKQKHGYIEDVEKPCDAFKIHLTPVGNTNFTNRDWYQEIISQFAIKNGHIYVFDNYSEAIQWAWDLNQIK